MRCPYCSSEDTKVVNSRPSDEGAAIRRRRECPNCQRRFTTYERAQFEALMVRKRSGRHEAFDADKLLSKLRIAANKRPVSEKVLREFAYGFEDEVQGPEVTSEYIGRRVLQFLKSLDDVAYIRYLSVYRDFDSVDRFIEEIRQLDADVAGKHAPRGSAPAEERADAAGEERQAPAAPADGAVEARPEPDVPADAAGTRGNLTRPEPS
ncbi:MAG TPA: transcriptional regulator NrdR [Trueperaceae bacterium]